MVAEIVGSREGVQSRECNPSKEGGHFTNRYLEKVTCRLDPTGLRRNGMETDKRVNGVRVKMACESLKSSYSKKKQ